MKRIVSVGGLGGSGTRVVAQVLSSSGVYFGEHLNLPLDNILFTRIFKNPKLIDSANAVQIKRLLDIFCKKMQGQNLSISETIYISKSILSNKCYNSSLQDTYYILRHKNKTCNPETWAWKEPNTHIYLDYLLRYIPNLKYIHVVRNGLDMKYSTNRKQVKNWGHLFNIDNNSENKQWNFWVKSTERVIEISKNYNNRVYLINYNKLCSNPKEEILKLFTFLEINLTENLLEHLSTIPKVTKKKYLTKDLQSLSDKELELMEKWAFNTK